MTITEALDLVNNQLIFRPGWHFSAAPSGYDWRKIAVTVRIETQNTNYPPDYRVPIVAGASDIQIDVSDLDEDGLLYAIETKVIEYANNHEDREFLRWRHRHMEAPFHPHHADGQLRWERQRLAGSRRHAA